MAFKFWIQNYFFFKYSNIVEIFSFPGNRQEMHARPKIQNIWKMYNKHFHIVVRLRKPATLPTDGISIVPNAKINEIYLYENNN